MKLTKSLLWISSTPEKPWQKTYVAAKGRQPDLMPNGCYHQAMQGFGGCFNELGGIALSSLTAKQRAGVMASLFDPRDGCRFSVCRMPIGASDYAARWYSHNEHDGDFKMRRFSIERDREHLLPYIRAALAVRQDLRLFASPWSPPTWMKDPAVFNHGTFIMEKRYLDAYALYFRKFVQAYQKEGIAISQIHPQNEPVADQKFPSCCWTGETMATFIGKHLGPCFEKAGLACDIWLGTLNTEDFNGWPRVVMSDRQARGYVKGIGLQWAGKEQAQLIHETYPDMPLMQTENECGDGQNTWDYAEYVFGLIRHYLSNGIASYIYWNMVLPPGGRSTWGWPQNAMITVDPERKRVTYNPEFYLMKHFSRFVKPGALRLGLRGDWTGNALAFENPNGSVTLVVHNPFNAPRSLTYGREFKADLQPRSFNTFLL